LTVEFHLKLALPKQLLLDAVMYAALFELITLPLIGWLSDKIGRPPFFILGPIFTMAFAFPLFWCWRQRASRW